MTERSSSPDATSAATPTGGEATPSAISRRMLMRSAGVLAGAAISAPVLRAIAQSPASPTLAPASSPVAPLDASTVPGFPSTALSARASFEAPALAPTGVTTGPSFSPLQDLVGTITPSDLHFQRHHNGIPIIDPARYSLTIHGLVARPVSFSLEELKRFPAVTRVHFIDCAGNGRTAYRAPRPDLTPQMIDGLTSNAEWTGVLVSTLLREAGVERSGGWVLAEGGDAARLSRSVPMSKMLDDALVAYAQNGEPVRLANGYPARLILPGYEGNMNIKWLRRLEVIDQPNMSRDETAKYTDPLPNGTSRQFSFVMDAKSIITSPAYPERLTSAGWWPVSGIAWTGRGRIARVDVSTDGGRTWSAAKLLGPVSPHAHARFQLMWNWDGQPAVLLSRAVDETGYVQPTLAEYRKVRGPGTDYHFNSIRSWNVDGDGSVTFGG